MTGIREQGVSAFEETRQKFGRKILYSLYNKGGMIVSGKNSIMQYFPLL